MKENPQVQRSILNGFYSGRIFEDQFQVFKMFGAVSRAQRMAGWSMCVYVCLSAHVLAQLLKEE